MRSYSFLQTWPKFYIPPTIFGEPFLIQQIVVEMAHNLHASNDFSQISFFTPTIFGEHGPNFAYILNHSGQSPTPTQTIFGSTGPAFSMVPWTLRRIFNKEAFEPPPPLRQYLLKRAQNYLQSTLTL